MISFILLKVNALAIFSTISSSTISGELQQILQKYDKRERPSVNGNADQYDIGTMRTNGNVFRLVLEQYILQSNKTIQFLQNESPGSVCNVTLQLAVVGLGPINDKSLTINMDFYLRHWWKDERLRLENKSVLTFSEDPSTIIWVPDTYFPNAVNTKSHQSMTPNIRVKIDANGNVYVSKRFSAQFICVMDLRLYPFDTQVCELLIESYSYTGREVWISWISTDVKIEYFKEQVQLSGFRLLKMEGIPKTRHYTNGEKFPILAARVTLKRTFTYSFYRAYVPSALLVVLTWSTFWIPPKAVPARVTIIVTNFLSTVFIIQEEGAKIVKVNYTTAMDIFLFTNLFFIIISMVEYLFILNCQRQKKAEKTFNVRNGLTNGITNSVALQKMENSDEKFTKNNDDLKTPKRETIEENKLNCTSRHYIDKHARILAPVMYIIFLVGYLGYYLHRYLN